MLIDLTGQRFERLIVIGRAPNASDKSHEARWHCRCDCGNTTISAGSDLRDGHTKSCGCYHREELSKRNTTHGRTGERLYRSWATIKQRCTNPDAFAYEYYGGRGITMCQEWQESYSAFADYMGIPPTGKYTIDRVDTNGHYEPGNMRWATRKEQTVNRRNSHMITHNGETLCLKDWGRKLGIGYNTLRQRKRAGWSDEKLLTPPAKKSNNSL